MTMLIPAPLSPMEHSVFVYVSLPPAGVSVGIANTKCCLKRIRKSACSD